jgi:[ribosomal protein S18]-alanine N-acetyltransferase
MVNSAHTIKKMEQNEAEEISKWEYEGEYAFYNMENDVEDLEELLSEEARSDAYYSVFSNNNQLIGFFSFLVSGKEVELGLGMNPMLTGKGKGLEFTNMGINYIVNKEKDIQKILLSVAAFNKRAIKVYERVGFQKVNSFMQKTNGSEYKFIKMEKNI